jgi:hypothetical protein
VTDDTAGRLIVHDREMHLDPFADENGSPVLTVHLYRETAA